MTPPPPDRVDLVAMQARHDNDAIHVRNCACDVGRDSHADRGQLLALVAALRWALDIETLSGYHDSSFLDPPSYHIEERDLWDCPQCVEQFIRRAPAALAALALTTREPEGGDRD